MNRRNSCHPLLERGLVSAWAGARKLVVYHVELAFHGYVLCNIKMDFGIVCGRVVIAADPGVSFAMQVRTSYVVLYLTPYRNPIIHLWDREIMEREGPGVSVPVRLPKSESRKASDSCEGAGTE